MRYGTIQSIDKIGAIAKSKGIIFHTDAVQAIGNMRIDVNKCNIDLLSMSGHKFYAPKGVGALYVKEDVQFEKLQDGGHQERNKRAGTENIAQIVGLGKAVELIYENFDSYNNKLKLFRDLYISEIEKEIPYAKLNGDRINRLPGNANISFQNIDAQKLLFKLDELGICASAGSACSTGESAPSHVLTAIGLDKNLTSGTLRVSFGDENNEDDVRYLIHHLVDLVKKIKNKEI